MLRYVQDFRDEATINAMGLDKAIELMKLYELKLKKEGKGESVFGKDSAIPSKVFEREEDNCSDVLHSLRYGKQDHNCQVPNGETGYNHGSLTFPARASTFPPYTWNERYRYG